MSAKRTRKRKSSKKRLVLCGRGPRGYLVCVEGRLVSVTTVMHDALVALFLQRFVVVDGYLAITSIQEPPESARIIIHRLRKAIGKHLVGNGFKSCYRLEVATHELAIGEGFWALKPGVDVGAGEFERLRTLVPQ